MAAVGRSSMRDIGEMVNELPRPMSSSAGETGALTLCEGAVKVPIVLTEREGVNGEPVALEGIWPVGVCGSTANVVEVGDS